MIPSEKVSDALAVIERNAASVSELVESLVDLSRRATGRSYSSVNSSI